MEEFRDGTFGGIDDLDKLLGKYVGGAIEAQMLKAIHVGSREELEGVRATSATPEEITLDKIKALSKRLEELEVSIKVVREEVIVRVDPLFQRILTELKEG